MIPSDVASRLHVSADAALRPMASIQEIADKLAGLAPGQRLSAEIQALLPNGTYRALINQRDITLALPFSAKAGDALELEVVSTDGKLALAVLSRAPGEAGKTVPESVPTTLSRTGQLIASLFANTSDAKSGATLTATALNGNQPLASSPPATAQDIILQLKQAITQSGLFYESHQAEWVAGRFDKNALLEEPQGKLLPDEASTARTNPPSPNTIQPHPSEPFTVTRQLAERQQTSSLANPSPTDKLNAGAAQPGQLVAPPVLALVQQQLEALATQNFAWQGQVWPGQTMRWEIEEDKEYKDGAEHQATESDVSASQWQTRLRLTLPKLGEVDAQIRLQGQEITLALTASNADTQALLRNATESLRSQLGEAGLALLSLGVSPSKESAAYVPSEN
jgi:Flagellar hook-length control protein FliK